MFSESDDKQACSIRARRKEMTSPTSSVSTRWPVTLTIIRNGFDVCFTGLDIGFFKQINNQLLTSAKKWKGLGMWILSLF
jgi:hypothetical protein